MKRNRLSLTSEQNSSVVHLKVNIKYMLKKKNGVY